MNIIIAGTNEDSVLLNNAVINEYAVSGSHSDSLFINKGVFVKDYIEIVAPVSDNQIWSASCIRDTLSKGITRISWYSYLEQSTEYSKATISNSEFGPYDMKLLYVNKFIGGAGSMIKIYISLEEKKEN